MSEIHGSVDNEVVGYTLRIEAAGLRKSDAIAFALRLIGTMIQEDHDKGHACGEIDGSASGFWEALKGSQK